MVRAYDGDGHQGHVRGDIAVVHDSETIDAGNM